MPFLPDGYEPSSGGVFTKFKTGTNHLRIITPQIKVGKELWTNGKPKRIELDEDFTPEDLANADDDTFNPGKKVRPKEFWVFVSWNYDTSQLEVTELTQSSIINPLYDKITNPKWGDPSTYDILIKKEGDPVKYYLDSNPKEELPEKVQKEVDKFVFDLDAFLNDGDVIIPKGQAQDKQLEKDVDEVFGE